VHARVPLICRVEELTRPLLERTVEVEAEAAVDAPPLLSRETPGGEAQREFYLAGREDCRG
jgi:hypothetical protein